MNTEVIAATRLPEVRTHLVTKLARELSNDFGPVLDSFTISIMAGAQAPSDAAVTNPHKQARLLAGDERRRLAEATLYWVSPNMTALAQAAAPGMPPFRPTTADLPSRYGLIYFAAPMAAAEEFPLAPLAVLDDGTISQIPGGTFPISAAAWGPWDYGGRWRHGGTWFTFYSGDGGDDDPHRTHVAQSLNIRPEHVKREALWLDNECVIGAAYDGPGEDPLPRMVRENGGVLPWVHLLLATFRLMSTSRTATVTEHVPVRAARRRAARLGVTAADRPVQLLDVTAPPRRERVPTAGDDDAGDAAGPGRTYRVRWIVDGHWRNQWYPASEAHRPRYIDAYVKGPKDAPLKVREKVHIWREPTEHAGEG